MITYTQTETDKDLNNNPIGWITFDGPLGTVRAYDIGWITTGYYELYPDRLWETYNLLIAVANGMYHCCLTGKVWPGR